MTPIDRLGIVGVGLIGGSLGLAVRRAGLAREIVGLGRSRANLDVALARGIVDRADSDPSVLSGADVVVLATPVASLAERAAAIAAHLAEGAIVTDVGSVKGSVVEGCSAALGARARFVGSHPMAGTEDAGAAAAQVDLFEGRPCIVTPVASTDAAALARVQELWRAVGMDVALMSPQEHDELVALTSHLPHVIAFSLRAIARERAAAGKQDPERLAGPSFQDATRVARSSPQAWRDILSANATAIAGSLERFAKQVDSFASTLRKGDIAELEKLLVRGHVQASAHPPASDAIRVDPARGPLEGRITLPGDKSIGHRALILGAVARGTTEISGLGMGEDNRSTIRVLRALGVDIEVEAQSARVRGLGFAGLKAPQETLDCGNSGTTMRLLSGLLAARPFVSRLDGDESLRRRPMRRVIDPLTDMGATFESRDGRPPLVVHGTRLTPGRFELSVASAQVKTAILLAGLQSDGETTVIEPGESRDHTERLLPAFGVVVERPEPRVARVRGPVELQACRIEVPADPSAAAFWLVAAAIVPGSRLTLSGVTMNPTRTGAIDVLRAMGARIDIAELRAIGAEPVADLCARSAPLHGTEIAGEQMLRAIDEFPILAVAAALASGETTFRDAAELRVKESDRIAAMAQGLASLGAVVEERPDGLRVAGGAKLHGGCVESHGDHRIAMAFAIAALAADGPVEIRGASAISVSDPSFLDALRSVRRDVH